MTVQEWLGEDNKLGIDIWEKKYQYNNESFDQWLDRVSGGDQEVRQLIKDKKFLFGGRILASRGLHNINPDVKTTYSNCYVLEAPEDNIESIFDCAKKLARTFSYGGGVGIDISKLAPCGAKVNNAAKESSGAVSFMDLYSMVTGLIAQQGRRGALMISMSCDHPDIEQFIDIKKDLDKVTKANISIRVTDEFMQAVIEDKPFELKFYRKETGENFSKTINARELMQKLAYNNWDMGEPGILFWDRIEDWNLLSGFDNFYYAGTNPCAEEPLPPFGSCLLGSLNLSEFVREDKTFDFGEFQGAVYKAIIALNKVLDEGLPLHPLQEQRDCVRDWRQIGLGIFGLADMLIKMNIKYGSDESLDLCGDIAQVMFNQALLASSNLARDSEVFPMYDYDSLFRSHMMYENTYMMPREQIANFGLRNSQLLTIAPTGTLSTMLGVSGGIEPIFANYYERKTESLHGEDVYYKVYTPVVKKYMEENNITDDKYLPEYFVTAKDLNYNDRINMQSVWQKYIDASISSTVNLPVDSTPEDVLNLYIDAWKAGLKGITVFRDGCRRASILSTTSHDTTDEDNQPTEHECKTVNDLPRGYIVSTSDCVIGKKRKLLTGCGSLHCTAFFDPITGDLMETYLSKGSTGGCNNFMIGLSRMISLAARSGCGIYDIIDQLNSCGSCPSYAVRSATKHDTSKGSCCPMAVGNALLDMWKEMQDEIKNNEDEYEEEAKPVTLQPNGYQTTQVDKAKCPSCGESLIFEGGCNICKSCGWSKCD